METGKKQATKSFIILLLILLISSICGTAGAKSVYAGSRMSDLDANPAIVSDNKFDPNKQISDMLNASRSQPMRTHNTTQIGTLSKVGLNGSSTTVYTDRSAWESAVGNTFEEEFFTDDILNPGVSIVSEYPGYIDTTKGVWWDRLVVPGQTDPTTGKSWPTGSTTTWQFITPIRAYGGYWDTGNPGGPGANIAVSINGISVGEIPNTYTGQFWGFVSTEPFSNVLLQSGSAGGAWCETYEMDNMVYGAALCVVELTKVDDINDGDCVGPGDDVNYTISYRYVGDVNCPNINDVNIIDELPEEVEFVSSVPEPNEIIDSNIIWHIGTLSPGESGFVTLKVKVKCPQPGSTITNECQIRGEGYLYSAAYEYTHVCPAPTLTKVDNITGCVNHDANITYSICYAANGYGDTNVVIIDYLPGGVNYVLSDPCGAYNPGDHTVTWGIALPPDACGCINLVVQVKHNVTPGGTIINHCEMTGDCIHLLADENTPVCSPTLTKVDNVPEGSCVVPDANITYLICYAANGYGDTNVVITDSLPPEVNFVWASNGGAYNPGNHTVTWDIGTLGPNGSNCLTLTVKVKPCVSVKPGTTITNCCEMTGDCMTSAVTACEDTYVCADPRMIKLDFNYDANNDDANTQAGFTKFIRANSGSEVNGVIIDLGGDIQSARRTDPCGTYGTPPDNNYYPRAGERIYRDFIYGIQPSGVTITLWELGVNRDCDITIWAYDACSTGDVNRVANWYSNGTYIFDTNFIGGSAGWPGYEANKPQDLYKYAFNGTATTDYLGRIILESFADPCTAKGQPFAFVNGLVVVPIGDFVPTKYAHRPVPFDGAEDVPVNVVLSWRPGVDANKHDVYLGTNFNDVNDANRTSHSNLLIYEPNHDADTFDPCGAAGFLKLDQTYYWRVDEVNISLPPIWKGEVWSFTTSLCAVVENFNSYVTTNALEQVWKDCWYQSAPVTRAQVFVQLGTADGNLVRDGNSMRYDYTNSASPYYSEARADIATLLPNGFLGQDPNWLGMGAKSLTLWFYGQPNNDANEKMYVKLADNGTPVRTAKVVYSGNMNDIRETKWHEWNIALQDFVDNNNVNLANVKTITIGFGNGATRGTGRVYFEDIRLCAPRCVLSKRSANFARVDYAPPGNPAGDCVIDYREIEMMANDWLMAPPPDPNIDLYGDGTIDFKDFAVLAEMWLEEELWP